MPAPTAAPLAAHPAHPAHPATPPAPLPGPTMAPVTWWEILREAYAGRPASAARTAVSSEHRVGSSHWVWVFAALVNGILLGAVAMLTVANAYASAWRGPSGVMYMAFFVFGVAVAFAYLCARAGLTCLLFALRRSSITFKDAAALASVPFAITTPLLVLCIPLALITGAFGSWPFVACVIFTVYFAETSAYVGIASLGRFEKSPVLLFAILSTVWLWLTTLVIELVALAIVEDLAHVVSDTVPFLP